MLLALKAHKLLTPRCNAYLCNVIDTRAAGFSLMDIPLVRDCLDIFPEDLPGLPPPREVEFCTYIAPIANPISKALYRIVPVELKELKLQLEELLKKGFP